MFCLPSLGGFLVFFFFQAEDGIRYHCVTGVQTCALPISVLPIGGDHFTRDIAMGTRMPIEEAERIKKETGTVSDDGIRSEERRVGKECRARWWQEQCKERGLEDAQLVHMRRMMGGAGEVS